MPSEALADTPTKTTASEYHAFELPRPGAARELHIDFRADGHLIGRSH